MFLRSVWVLGSLFFWVGCGRQATEADCDLLIERNIEVALPEGLDEKLRAEKVANYKKQLEGELKSCLGKRVTDAYLNCIRGAKTAEMLRACGK